MSARSRAILGALLAIGLAALAAAAAALVEIVDRASLVLSDGRGRVLARIPLAEGRFDHVFIHSFHLSPVEERFKVEDSGDGPILRLYELRYENSGTGMPTEAEGGFRLEGGKFILAMDRQFKKIPIRVSILEGHGIVAGGVFHPFREWVGPEGLIVLTGRTARAIRFRR
jgi:hypothetical protein